MKHTLSHSLKLILARIRWKLAFLKRALNFIDRAVLYKKIEDEMKSTHQEYLEVSKRELKLPDIEKELLAKLELLNKILNWVII